MRTPKPLFTRVESSRNGICSSRNGLGTSVRGAIKTERLCTSWFCPFTLLWLLNRTERDAVVDCCVKLAPMKETGHRIEAVSECVQRRICGDPGARPGPCTLRRGSLWAAVRGGHRDAATPEEARAAAAAKAAAGLDAAVLRDPHVIRHNKRLYDEGHHEVRGRTMLCVLGVLGAIRSPLASAPVCMVAMRLQPGCERASTQADVRHGVHASLTSQPLELTSGRLPVQTVAVVRALLKAADIEMLEPLELIPDKPFTPANGDKRTYVSLATYCWPSNPDDLQNPKGPWECKDGLPFPGVRTPHQHINMHGFVVPCTLPGRSRAARMPRRRTGLTAQLDAARTCLCKRNRTRGPVQWSALVHGRRHTPAMDESAGGAVGAPPPSLSTGQDFIRHLHERSRGCRVAVRGTRAAAVLEGLPTSWPSGLHLFLPGDVRPCSACPTPRSCPTLTHVDLRHRAAFVGGLMMQPCHVSRTSAGS